MGINYKNIKEEILNRIRNADILTISQRGVTTVTETFDGTGSQTDFTVANSGVKNIRVVSVDSNTQIAITDYTYNLTGTPAEGKVISFTVAPGSGTDNVSITYDYSASGDKIYDDFPIPSIKVESYPRIAFDIISENTSVAAMNHDVYQSDLLFEFRAYGVGRNQTEDLLTSLRDFLLSIRKDLVRLEYIEPKGKSNIKKVENTSDLIFQRVCNFSAPLEFEEI